MSHFANACGLALCSLAGAFSAAYVYALYINRKK